MDDNEEGEAGKETQESNENVRNETKENSDKTGKKGGKKDKKTWDEKVAEENQKKKDEFMPWGSDPCVKIRLKFGKLPDKEISAVKGSTFPWYEPCRKAEIIKKEEDKREEKKIKESKDNNEEKFEAIVRNNMERIKNLSEEVRKKRIFEANRKLGDTETYEQYCARKEKSERRRQKWKTEQDQGEEKKRQEKDEEKEKECTKKDWPGSYPATITEDFITMIKMIIEAEFETKPSERKRRKRQPKPSKKDKILTEFTSFLGVLFTATEMMKEKDRNEEVETNNHIKPKSRQNIRQSVGEIEKEIKSITYADPTGDDEGGDTKAVEEEGEVKTAEELPVES